MPSRDEMQAQIDEGKPRPKPNLAAEIPGDVYPMEQLVGGERMLRAMAVKEWIDKVAAGEDVQTRSMFVARRIRHIVLAGDVKRIRILRFLLLLVEWSRALKEGGRGSKRVPKMEDMGTLVETWGADTILALGRRFALDKYDSLPPSSHNSTPLFHHPLHSNPPPPTPRRPNSILEHIHPLTSPPPPPAPSTNGTKTT